MAQYDVHESDGTFVIDCQSDLLDEYDTRLVVPLMRPENSPRLAGRLNPKFEIGGETYAMYTQYAASVPFRSLGKVVVSLAGHRYEILGAIDVLVTGV